MASTNQHGVHSPFVYDYITKCLYQKKLSRDSKVKDVLLKSLGYFTPKNVLFDGIDEEYLDVILTRLPSLKLNNPAYDFIYIDELNERSISTYIVGNKNIHNNTVVLINSIHGNKYMETQWEDLKKTEQIRVTVDLFYCGLVFFRKEQAREHFKIRI